MNTTDKNDKINNNNTINIDSRKIFNQIVTNLRVDKDDEKDLKNIENINAKDLNNCDAINIINNDDFFDQILCLTDILLKEIDDKK